MKTKSDATAPMTGPAAGAPGLASLIERLEAATEGSRELDALLWRVADPTAFERQCSFRGNMYAGHVHTKVEKHEHIKRTSEYFAPHYTTSIDAALTLVPAGLWWVLNSGVSQGRAIAMLKGAPAIIEAYARTPPLAICAAALKARQAATGAA